MPERFTSCSLREILSSVKAEFSGNEDNEESPFLETLSEASPEAPDKAERSVIRLLIYQEM